MESVRGGGQRADLFDPASLAALGRIEIVARWIVDGFMSGLHRSPRKGFSVEFAEYRPYQPGDDLRYIDWKIAARSDRWVVRQYEEETNLRATHRPRRQSARWPGAAIRCTLGGRSDGVAGRLTKLALRRAAHGGAGAALSSAARRRGARALRRPRFARRCRRERAMASGGGSSPALEEDGAGPRVERARRRSHQAARLSAAAGSSC